MGIYVKQNGKLVPLANYSGGGTNIAVDSELSETSENPVQNKVITEKINEIESQMQEDDSGYMDTDGKSIAIYFSNSGVDDDDFSTPFRTLKGTQHIWGKYPKVEFVFNESMDMSEDADVVTNNKYIAFHCGVDNASNVISLPRITAVSCNLNFYGITLKPKKVINLIGGTNIGIGGYAGVVINDTETPLFMFGNQTSDMQTASINVVLRALDTTRTKERPIFLSMYGGVYAFPVVFASIQGISDSVMQCLFARGSYNESTKAVTVSKNYTPTKMQGSSELYYFV